MAERTEQSAHESKIREICSPCDHFMEMTLECRLLYGSGSSYLQIFEDKRCRPRDYLIRFFESRLRRIDEPNLRARAEDLAHSTVQRLIERTHDASFLSRDLVGSRRFLSARAQQILIDERRRVEGRMRCGNCRHHGRGQGGARICRHPRGDHPWSGRVVVASEDPRKFEPPCERYQARQGPKSLDDGPPGWEPASETPDPLQLLEEDERLATAADCFAAVQRARPELWLILRRFFFEKRSLQDIAAELAVSSKTVMRRKSEALELLRAEFESRGVEGLEAIA